MQLFLKLSIWAQLIMSFSTVYATPILASSISASSSHDTHLKNQHFNGNDNNDSNFDDRKLSNMPQRISEYENRDENENDASENHYEINLYIAEPKVQPELKEETPKKPKEEDKSITITSCFCCQWLLAVLAYGSLVVIVYWLITHCDENMSVEDILFNDEY